MVVLHEIKWNSSRKSLLSHLAETLEYLFLDQTIRLGRLAERPYRETPDQNSRGYEIRGDSRLKIGAVIYGLQSIFTGVGEWSVGLPCHGIHPIRL